MVQPHAYTIARGGDRGYCGNPGADRAIAPRSWPGRAAVDAIADRDVDQADQAERQAHDHQLHADAGGEVSGKMDGDRQLQGGDRDAEGREGKHACEREGPRRGRLDF